MVFESESYEQTLAIGRRIASRLKAGDVVALDGDLGAGKTALTAGIAEYFGFQDGTSSPTFTIINQYDTPVLTIYHMDAYRLDHAEELDDIGFWDLLYSGGIMIIEWADKIKDALPKETIRVRAYREDEKGENYRRFEIDWGHAN
jgi:tRNA threonylcarbamoyladenosine biosynthesis protein TsaE